ncbi:MAG TPA: HD-GYP domain-containing protein [Solirubrobacterales bacterium]|nr:HD-GYP domain-containing protein [Solirubrobacterales bacterium]
MDALLNPISPEAPSPEGARTLRQLAAELEARIPGATGHSRRVARYAAGVARHLGLPRERVARLRWAAALHDIGKLKLPPRVVNKPGPLSELEYAMVRRHAAIGARIVARFADGELAAIVRHHHERFDGSGYPDGLAGERIPLGARVVAVADTFDAITSARPYQPAKRHHEALELLADEAGTQLDPEVVAVFHDFFAGPREMPLRVLAR